MQIPGFLWQAISRSLVLIVIIHFSAGRAHGEVLDSTRKEDMKEVLRDTVTSRNKTDILDVVKIIIGLKKDPFHKKHEKTESGPFYNFYAYPGYSLVTGWNGTGTFNIAYRPKKNIEGNQSYLYNSFLYTQYKQIIFISLSDIYTNNNKWQFPGQLYYFNFPTVTYGLGSGSLPSAADNIDYSHIRFYRSFLRELVPSTFLGFGYNLDYRWNITDYNAAKGIVTDFVKYGYTKTSSSSGPSFSFLYDTRDNPNQCHEGAYVHIQFVPFLKTLGSNSNWNSLLLDMRKFIPLTHRWYLDLAVWGYVWLTLNGHPPYLDMPSIGWDAYNNTGRAYAAGRYRGLDMLYLETELRFDILRNGLLGAVVFGNLQTFTGATGGYFGPIQPAGGAGLRIKFNKNTHSNSCFDYGYGSHGSRGVTTDLNEIF